MKAYFAKKIETEKSFTEQPYVVAEKDTYKKIAANVKHVDTAELRKHKLVPGETITLKVKKKTKELSFKQLKQAKIGDKVYIIVETSELREGKVQVDVLGSNNTTFVKKDEQVSLLQGGTEKTSLMANVGAWAGKTEYANASSFLDWAIIEIELKPGSKDKIKDWAKKISDSAEKKAFLHLKVTAEGGYDTEYTCEDDTMVSPDKQKGIFLNKTGLWFELCACYCQIKMDKELFKQVFSIKNDYVFGHNIMKKHTGTYQTDIDNFLAALNTCFTTYEVNNCNRRTHILGQMWLETDVFKSLEEYASGLGYEPGARVDAKPNGNTKVGDGPKYKGRGCMQLTWKNAYKLYQKHINKYPDYTTENLVDNYAKVSSDLFLAVDSAGWFWKYGKLKNDGTSINFNKLADTKQVDTISVYVNGGGTAKAERKAITTALLTAFNADLCPNIPEY